MQPEEQNQAPSPPPQPNSQDSQPSWDISRQGQPSSGAPINQAVQPSFGSPQFSEPSAQEQPVSSSPPSQGQQSPLEQPRPGVVVSGQPVGSPSAQSLFAPAMASPNHPAPLKKSKKKAGMLALIITAAVILLGAVGGAAYYVWILPNTPENVLKAALGNMLTAKTAQFSGEFSVKDAGSSFTMGGTFEGASDAAGPFDIHAEFDAAVTTVKADIRSVDGKNMFVRLGGLAGAAELLGSLDPTLPELYGPLVASVDNQWYEINQSLLSSAGLWAEPLTEAETNKLANAYLDNPFLTVKDVLENEQVGGIDSHHYKVAVDGPMLKEFVKAVKALNIESLNITDDNLKALNQAIDKEDLSKYPFEVWIAKDTKQFSKVAFSYSDESSVFKISMQVRNYDQPVKVEKPEGARSVLELLGEAAAVFQASGELFGPALDDSFYEGLPEETGISL